MECVRTPGIYFLCCPASYADHVFGFLFEISLNREGAGFIRCFRVGTYLFYKLLPFHSYSQGRNLLIIKLIPHR